MKAPTTAQQRIADIFAEIEAEFADKTVAWMITLTCDRYENETGIGIDHAHVRDALSAVGDADDGAD